MSLLLPKGKKRENSRASEIKERKTKSRKGTRSQSRPGLKTKKNKNIKGMMDKITFKIRKPRDDITALKTTLPGKIEKVNNLEDDKKSEEEVSKVNYTEDGNNIVVVKSILNDGESDRLATKGENTNDKDGQISEDLTGIDIEKPADVEESVVDGPKSLEPMEEIYRNHAIADALMEMVEERVGVGKYVEDALLDMITASDGSATDGGMVEDLDNPIDGSIIEDLNDSATVDASNNAEAVQVAV